MGVERTDYLMVATDIGFDSFDWDKHQAEVEGAQSRRFDIILDGMSGGYCLAGKVIAKSDPHDGIEMVKIDPEKLGVDRAELAAKVAEAFGRELSADDFSLVLFSHFY